MTNAEKEILEKVHEISKTHPGGEEFFDKLDGEIIGNASPTVLAALFELVPSNHSLVLSGGFGKRVAQGIDSGELPRISYVLFKGGIRSGGKPEVIRGRRMPGKFSKDAIFLDDSIYGGATYEALKEATKGLVSLRKCAVIYDGCPVKKTEITSVFRYYDHFKATPNFKF
jgi:hypothetical protein